MLFRKSDGIGENHPNGLTPTQIIVLTFLIIILAGAVLLWLPVVSRNGERCSFITALFTATSATCITGLSLVDIWTQWNFWGQAVILVLIEIGGLGFMSALSLAIFAFRRKITLKQRMVMAQAMGVTDTGGVVRLQRWMLKNTMIIQLIGTAILTLNFLPRYGFFHSLWLALFLSVSAYCNAGFDLFGFENPGGSLTAFSGDPVTLLTVSALIIYGGIGFLVLEPMYRRRKVKSMNIYAKIVLTMTIALLAGGTIGFCLLEWNNPRTLGAMNTPEKILGAFFQSVTSRTAGFAAVRQESMTEAGKALTTALMMIGGASSSTAGGIKVGTLFVIVAYLLARGRGLNSVTVFNRTISTEQILNAMTITGIMVSLSLMGCVVISISSHVALGSGLFEAVSAISNTGLTIAGTSGLSMLSWILLIVFMFFGRVGVFTISLSFLIGSRTIERIHYPETKLLIG